MALLAAVKANNVVEGVTADTEGDTWLIDPEVGTLRRVSGQIADALRAGWVCLPMPYIFWDLTELGKQVLAQNRTDQASSNGCGDNGP